MKKIVFLFSLILGFVATAQNIQAPPQGINYQAVVYDMDGGNMPGVDAGDVVLANKDIGVRFSINKNHPYGQTIYKEVHYTTTDKYGMFNLVIGMGNSNIGTFSSIDWGAGTYFLKVEVAKNVNQDFVEISNAQFWSVPYALYAKGSHDGVQTISDNGDGSITVTYTDSTQVIGPSSWALKDEPIEPITERINFCDVACAEMSTKKLKRIKNVFRCNMRLGQKQTEYPKKNPFYQFWQNP